MAGFLFHYNFRLAADNDVICSVAVDDVGMDVRVKFGDSRSNDSWDIRGADFVSFRRKPFDLESQNFTRTFRTDIVYSHTGYDVIIYFRSEVKRKKTVENIASNVFVWNVCIENGLSKDHEILRTY